MSNLCRLESGGGSINVPGASVLHRSFLILFPVDGVSGGLSYVLTVLLGICQARHADLFR